MKNTLSDLNNHLFAQLERLGDEGLTKEQLSIEVDRGRVITSVAQQVISNARLVLDAQTAMTNGDIEKPLPMLGSNS